MHADDCIPKWKILSSCSCNLLLLPKFVSANPRGIRRERGETRSGFVALILNKGVW